MTKSWLRRFKDALTFSGGTKQDQLAAQVEDVRAWIHELHTQQKSVAGELATMRQNLEQASMVAATTLARMEHASGNLRMAAAESEIARIRELGDGLSLSEVELSVFSQMGEDGILQYILSRIEIPHRTFVEFGVTNYKEANTRFLALHDEWTGLVLDCDASCVDEIRQDEVCWRYGLDAQCEFVTRDNIDSLLSAHPDPEDLGLLSIDVDGNDYWIWEAIHVVRPRVVICEYNGVFGAEHPITIPYQEDFFRTRAHYSNLYFGCSLPALCRLAKTKGYHFIGCNRAGINAFFVRDDLSGPFRVLDAATGFVASRFRESRDRDGVLTFLSGADRIREIQDCEVIHLDRAEPVRIGDLLL